ncbi:MAG: ABC transporter ATP-binding protein [Verrucomicrobia bacterium]|nr:ABC transporter ATP-binding protein [Verrucomicrobiota bacterium]
MSSDTKIVASGLGKFYPHRLETLRLLRYLAPWPQRHTAEDFWALRNLSFRLEPGKALGVIGRNGSGKSTLLQLVAGLLEPSEGIINVNGKVAALLELGAGFNPEFTGRENVFLSGSVYGYSRAEMAERFDEIVEFAAIGDHLDQPVKTYSSGMYARLAFSVAIQVDPDILLIDEILSVGDLGFQAKCFRKIEALREAGTSIMFVSHDLNAVQMLCDEALFLDEGVSRGFGEPREIANAYVQMLSERVRLGKQHDPVVDSPTGALATIRNVELLNARGENTMHPSAGERCRVRYKVEFYGDVAEPVVTMQLRTMLGLVVSDLTSVFSNTDIPPCAKGDVLDVDFEFDCNLCPGPFRIGASIAGLHDGVPASICGGEFLTIEVVSSQRAYGIAFVDSSLHVRKAGEAGAIDN